MYPDLSEKFLIRKICFEYSMKYSTKYSVYVPIIREF